MGYEFFLILLVSGGGRRGRGKKSSNDSKFWPAELSPAISGGYFPRIRWSNLSGGYGLLPVIYLFPPVISSISLQPDLSQAWVLWNSIWRYHAFLGSLGGKEVFYFCLAENSRFFISSPILQWTLFCRCCWKKKTHKTKQKTAREAGAVYSETANGLLIWTNWKWERFVCEQWGTLILGPTASSCQALMAAAFASIEMGSGSGGHGQATFAYYKSRGSWDCNSMIFVMPLGWFFMLMHGDTFSRSFLFVAVFSVRYSDFGCYSNVEISSYFQKNVTWPWLRRCWRSQNWSWAAARAHF